MTEHDTDNGVHRAEDAEDIADGVLDDGRLIERGPGIGESLRSLRRSLTVSSVGAGIVSAVFGCTGPALIIVDGAESAGLSAGQTVAWISAVYLVGGLISFILGLYYKQPIVGAWSIPAAALVVSSLQTYSLGEMIGAYLVASLLVLGLGMTGWVRTLVAWIPMPILMAMIGGILIGYAVNMVDAAAAAPVVVAAALLGYVLLTRFVRQVPGVVGALAFGVVAVLATGGLDTESGGISWQTPELTAPEWNLFAMLGVGIPLALVIQAENIQSMGVLMAEGYRPPVNSITVASGIASLVVTWFGGHNASIAGPMTAICGSPEAGSRRDRRYASVLVNGAVFIAFGLFASIAVTLVTTLPSQLITALAGLAMLGVLLTAFRGAFATPTHRLGALTAMIIGLGDVTIAGISAPFWALLGGLVVSLLLEFDDFRSTDSARQKERT